MARRYRLWPVPSARCRSRPARQHFHRGFVRRDHLHGKHGLDFICGLHPIDGGERRVRFRFGGVGCAFSAHDGDKPSKSLVNKGI